MQGVAAWGISSNNQLKHQSKGSRDEPAMPGSGEGAVLESLCNFMKEERAPDRQTSIISGRRKKYLDFLFFPHNFFLSSTPPPFTNHSHDTMESVKYEMTTKAKPKLNLSLHFIFYAFASMFLVQFVFLLHIKSKKKKQFFPRGYPVYGVERWNDPPVHY